MNDMKLASHNSWSYLKPLKWWMRPFRFMSRCQDVDIKTQYEEYGVRCFDLRLHFTNAGEMRVNHSYMNYAIKDEELFEQMEWLDKKKDVAVRILLDIRNKIDYTDLQISMFKLLCSVLENKYTHIKFWCGRNLYNWNVEYAFSYEPTCAEKYSSVCKPALIDDWYPRWFAKKHTKELYKKGSSADFLMLDFVNYIK